MAKKNPNLLMENLNEDDRTIWSTELVEKSLEAIENGYELPHNPFYEKDIQYRKGNIMFNYTEEEIEEIELCANNVIHFSKHCFVMQDHGLDNIKLRDYQEEILETYQNNKKVCFMAARQIGKCFFSDTSSWFLNKETNEIKSMYIYELYYNSLKNKTFLEKVKFWLYKLYSKLK